ncbi:MAG TPA: DUF948 domain-containing protein [Actinotalea sp.]|nr:DUF948 domain-containing protein [Actinotalea sp.]
MDVGDIAGLLGAIGFLILVGFLALPLYRLAQVFDGARASVKELTDHTVPLIDETTTTIATTNAQLVKVDTVTTSAAEISQNVSALTALIAATVGGPLIKVAAFSYGVRQALSDLAAKVRR